MAKMQLFTGADHRGAEALRKLSARLKKALPELEITPVNFKNRFDDDFNLPAELVVQAVLEAENAENRRISPENGDLAEKNSENSEFLPENGQKSPKDVEILSKNGKNGQIPPEITANLPRRTVFGLLLCGSGHGVCMQANRFAGVRAVNAPSAESAREAREHSDANVLCLAADYLKIEEMLKITQVFLESRFLGTDNYRRRVRMLDALPLPESEMLPEFSDFGADFGEATDFVADFGEAPEADFGLEVLSVTATPAEAPEKLPVKRAPSAQNLHGKGGE